jgi:hypothetical protein
MVIDLAEDSFIAETNLELCVTPATKIPIIKITIDNSISEKAFLLIFIIFNYKNYFLTNVNNNSTFSIGVAGRIP